MNMPTNVLATRNYQNMNNLNNSQLNNETLDVRYKSAKTNKFLEQRRLSNSNQNSQNTTAYQSTKYHTNAPNVTGLEIGNQITQNIKKYSKIYISKFKTRFFGLLVHQLILCNQFYFVRNILVEILV